MHGAFESEPLHCKQPEVAKSTKNRNVARDLHKEFESSASWRTRASRATPDYDRYVGLLIDAAVEYNKQQPKTYNLEEAKVEVRRRIAEKLADREL